MNAVAERIGSSFVLAAGDNFYHSGIASDAHDARFKETFEDVYTGEALQTPWLAIAGNHDHKGNVSAQIAYSELSERWTYPSQFHSHSFESDGVSVDILMIDTGD
jgi:DNA repair exonuclease SbcCD nuclease subunit